MFLFSKMQATGNDFIVLNYLEEKLEYSFKLLSSFLCDRHFGIGADGVLIIEKSNVADFKMRIFNKDGEEAEMCGNGIRCISKYVFEKKLISKNEFIIETLAGIKKVELKIEGNTVVLIKVNMGMAFFEKSKIPMIFEEGIEKFRIDNMDVYPVSVGNPHCVCFVENIDEIDVEKYGKLIENYKYFPNKTNVEFVQIINKDNIKIKIWERGVGETLSCGTGACASVVVANKYKNLNSDLVVYLPGGRLFIKIMDNEIFLSGGAEFVFDGKIEI